MSYTNHDKKHGYSHDYASNTGVPKPQPRPTQLSMVDLGVEPDIPDCPIPSGVDAPQHRPYEYDTTIQAPKRAYRQRRKDPSCDACRERKVKCDATDAKSCSECSNRSVRCQFTKETNRRMSSFKQVQDLEKQLLKTQDELSALRSKLNVPQKLEVTSALPPSPERPSKKAKFDFKYDFSQIRRTILSWDHGFIMPPSQPLEKFNHAVLPSLFNPPARAVGDRLVARYRTCFLDALPVLNWPSFMQRYEKTYQAGSLEELPQAWAALFYAVLACGSLCEVERDEYAFERFSRISLLLNSDDLSCEHAAAGLLLSVFLLETNRTLAAWTTLGYAIRVGQCLGLHRENGNYKDQGDDLPRHLWWCIYMTDRLIALELGRPVAINDSDCTVELPKSLLLTKPGKSGEQSSQDSQPGLLFLSQIYVARGISPLVARPQEPFLSESKIRSIDERLLHCLRQLPLHHHPSATDYIDPFSIGPVIYLQNARLVMQRLNLTPQAPSASRFRAIDECTKVAQQTSRLIGRSMQTADLNSSYTWEEKLCRFASAFLCTHLCRCILFLSFCGDYTAALICAKAGAAFGSVRPVNVSCSRYLEYFLLYLEDRLQTGLRTCEGFDEEMVAYISADLQRGDGSWIFDAHAVQDPSADDIQELSADAPVSSRRHNETAGKSWSSIIARLESFQANHMKPYYYINRADLSAQHENLHFHKSPLPSQAPTSSPRGTSRMSIAEILSRT